MSEKITNIEQIYVQGSGAFNEDNLTCSGDLFGVFDGSSSLVPELYSGKSGAWWASHLVSSEFSKNDASLYELGKRANQKLQQTMSVEGVVPSDHLQCWSTSAAVCRVEGDSLEWLQSGDCQVLAILENGDSRLLTPYHNHDKPTLQMLKRLLDQNDPEPQKKIRPQLKKVRQQMNRSYGVINGEAEALDFFQTGSCSLSGIKHLLIFTDGVNPPNEGSNDAPDFNWVAQHYLSGGLQQVKQEIRQAEKQDPDCRRYPRFKRHDDMAAIAISFA